MRRPRLPAQAGESGGPGVLSAGRRSQGSATNFTNRTKSPMRLVGTRHSGNDCVLMEGSSHVKPMSYPGALGNASPAATLVFMVGEASARQLHAGCSWLRRTQSVARPNALRRCRRPYTPFPNAKCSRPRPGRHPHPGSCSWSDGVSVACGTQVPHSRGVGLGGGQAAPGLWVWRMSSATWRMLSLWRRARCWISKKAWRSVSPWLAMSALLARAMALRLSRAS